MKISIKDIFDSEKNMENSQELPIEETPVQENRMIKISKALEQKGVVLKETIEKSVDQKKMNQELKRIKQVARINEWGSVNNFDGTIPFLMNKNTNSIGAGQTVNTFMNVDNTNPNSNKIHNPNYTYLSEAEALRLAISRALNSGDPTVHKLGFYEEINQTLNGLGFNARSPIDIKEMVLKMMS